LKLNDFQKSGWKHIYNKGIEGRQPRTPGLWIRPKKQRFHVRASTTASGNEGCNPKYTIAIGKWINVAHVISGRNVKFYVNGKVVRSCRLKGFMNPNQYPLHVGSGNNLDADIKFMEYSNYALSPNQIMARMNRKKSIVRD